MPAIVHNEPFTGGQFGRRTAIITCTTGSATLEVCGADDPSEADPADWRALRLGEIGEGDPIAFTNANGQVTFSAESGIWYRWILTGDASGAMSGE